MKFKLLAGLLVAGALPFVLGSCKDDEPPKVGITFEKEGEEITESDGTTSSIHPELVAGSKGRTVTVKLVLDKKLEETAIVKYSVGGTASRESTSDGAVNDYVVEEGLNTIVGANQIAILAGATEATVKVTVFEDYEIEVDDDGNSFETIELTLESVVSGPIKLPAPVTYTLQVDEDDLVVILVWGDATADLDLILWAEGEPNSLAYGGSDPGAADPYEILWIPGGFPDGDYGFSYTYYKGTNNALNFGVLMYGNVNNTFYPYFGDDAASFTGTYSLANINAYDQETGVDPIKVQDVTKSGTDFSVGGVTIPSQYSRSAGPVAFKDLKISSSVFQRIRATAAKDFDHSRSLKK